MGSNIQSIGTIFRSDIGVMGNIDNNKSEIMELPAKDTNPVLQFSFSNFVRNVLSVLKEDFFPVKKIYSSLTNKNMGTAKMTWVGLCSIFGIPATALTFFSDLFNIHMQEPYKSFIGLLAVVYMATMCGRGLVRLWSEIVSTAEKHFDLKRKIKANGSPNTNIKNETKK